MQMNPFRWSVCEWISKLSVLNLLTPLFHISLWHSVPFFFFWRAMYDLGLGLLLRWQSNSQGITRLTSSLLAKPHNSLGRRLLLAVVRDGHPDYNPEDHPVCLTAWMAYRRYADTVLAWDLMSYFGVILSCITRPAEGFTFVVCLEYAVGIFLCFFALWAKTDSYRVVQDYAWYWGDFFFRVKGDLSFDRVFNIAPHPMYSIGYSFFYGAAIITRSPVAFHISVIAHMCQFAFLAFAETPHMRKIYPEMTNSDPASISAVKDRLLHDSENGYFSHEELVGIRHFNPLRSADKMLVCFAIPTIIFYLICIFNVPKEDPFSSLLAWGAVIVAVCWRLVLCGGLGVVLRRQSENNWWVDRFKEKGKNAHEAFNAWKGIYNLVHTMTILSFALTGVVFRNKLFPYTGKYLVPQSLGVLCLLLSYTTIKNVFEDIGEYGWFYGDFFIPKKEVPTQLVYTGVYRFLDNPDSVIGFVGYYGIALFFESPVAFAIAVFSQVINYLFILMVERPHMNKFYGSEVRKESGIESALGEIISDAFSQTNSNKMS